MLRCSREIIVFTIHVSYALMMYVYHLSSLQFSPAQPLAIDASA